MAMNLVAVSVALLALACGDDETTAGDGGAGATSTGGAGGTGGMSAGGMGGMVPDVTPCGDPATPFETGCPAVCTGGCDGGTCTILCNQPQACNASLRCPAGMPCQVTCSGENSCRFEVACDDYYGCSVLCGAVGACTGLEVACGEFSDCDMSCLVGDACSGATLACGDGACGSQCLADAQPSVVCGESCNCADCN